MNTIEQTTPISTSSTSLKDEYVSLPSINDVSILKTRTKINVTDTNSLFFIPSASTESEVVRIVPIMSREKLMTILNQFEQKYGMGSQEFYDKWLAGKAPDMIDTLKWVVFWEAWHAHYLI